MRITSLGFIVVIREVSAHLVFEIQRSFLTLSDSLALIIHHDDFNRVKWFADAATFG